VAPARAIFSQNRYRPTSSRNFCDRACRPAKNLTGQIELRGRIPPDVPDPVFCRRKYIDLPEYFPLADEKIEPLLTSGLPILGRATGGLARFAPEKSFKGIAMHTHHFRQDDAERLAIGGGELTRILLDGGNTGNRLSLFASHLKAGNAIPLHYHEIDLEIFHIVTGELAFQLEDRTFTAHAGDTISAGPMMKRGCTALTDTHLIIINSPAGPSEALMRDLATLPAGTAPSADMQKKFREVYRIHLVDA
jgi:quercetin dioxygenase-like cupin family protein